MLTNLTKEQEALIPIVRDEWINRLDSCPKIDREAAITGMKWLYSLAKLKEPEVIIVDSPLGAQMLAAALKNKCTVGASVEDSVRDSVGASVRDSVWDSVVDSVGNSVGASVWAPVVASVRASVVEASVRAFVEDSVWDSVRVSVGGSITPWSWYGRIDDYSWTAFYDYFERIGIDLKCEHWANWKRFITSGLFVSIQLDGLAIICSMPKYLKREAPRGRLHCTTGPAIEWKDGFKLYRLWGVHFDEPLFNSITNKTISQKEVFAIENQEQRMAALKVLGPEYVLTEANSVLLDTSIKGDKLYEVRDVIPDEIIYAVQYKCPSTGRVYIDYVHPDIGEQKDAAIAMASKGRLSKVEWINNIVNHT